MSKPKSFTVLRDSETNQIVKAGDTVYDFWGCDYGCASDDTRMTGIEWTAVTLSPEGKEPFFTVPVRDLKRLEDPKSK